MMGLRKDGRNLVNEWQSAHPREAAYVWNKEDFDDVDPDTTEYVFGNHINIYFIFITSNLISSFIDFYSFIIYRI